MKIGDEFTSNNCGIVVILGSAVKGGYYRVQFKSTGYIGVFSISAIKEGRIKDPLCRSVAGVGYFGVGAFKSGTLAYVKWKSMIDRCYGKMPAKYAACTVCDDWHNFQTFAAWLIEQPNWNRYGWEIDKDMRVPGNTVYSPETCHIVTKEENSAYANKMR